MATESATKPAAGAAGWSASAPTSFTFASEGSKTLYAWAKDAAGNVSAAKSAAVVITLPDTQAPSVSITAPANGAAVSGLVNLAASASDNVGVAKVEFYVDGSLKATDASAPYGYSLDSSGLSNASHIILAKAYDAAGNSQSAQISVTVSNVGNFLVLSPQDTFLNLDAINNVSGGTLNTYTWPSNKVANAILMKFDLSGLPAGAVIQSAMLNMALTDSDASTDASYRVTAHKIINKNPDLTKATGMTYDGVNAWSASTQCYNNIPLAQGDISASYALADVDKNLGFKAWDLTLLAKEWQGAPAANFGLLLNSDASKSSDRFRTFASMEAVDAGQRPYLRISYSLAVDATAPSVTFSMPATATSLTVAITAFTATDNIGVTGYMVSESATKPAAGAAGWSASAPTSFTFASEGSKTLYAWAKDAAGNVSAAKSASVVITLPDTAAPVVSAFSLPASATSLTVAITAFTASDNKAVTGYMVSESSIKPAAGAAGWSASAPTSFTFSSEGSKTL
jgi:hypothetical protein